MAWFEETVSACDEWRPPPQLKEGDELSRSTCSQTSPEHAAIAVQAWWRGFMVRLGVRTACFPHDLCPGEFECK
eukprot:28780-Eustigmatos_ZCMA.PRE.1